MGYTKRLLKNPSYVSTIYDQCRDYVSWQKTEAGLEKPVKITPFYYMEWNKQTVISTIEKLGWGYDDKFNSSWRSDCYINLLRQFVYKKMVGFNDLDVYYGQLVREKEMSLPEALAHIETEGKFDEDVVREIFRDFYNIDYDKIKDKMEMKEQIAD